jgi:hypothetical protein
MLSHPFLPQSRCVFVFFHLLGKCFSQKDIKNGTIVFILLICTMALFLTLKYKKSITRVRGIRNENFYQIFSGEICMNIKVVFFYYCDIL